MIFNRKLKAEIASLKADNQSLNDELSAFRNEIIELRRKLKTYDKTKAENMELRGKLRNQLGADLLINALQALGIIDPPKEPVDYHDASRALQQQMSGLQSIGYRASLTPVGNLSSALFGSQII